MTKPIRLMFVFAALLCFLQQARSADKIIMTEDQIENLGIQIITPGNATEIPLTQFPAQITIPPAQEFIISAPQSGLVNANNIASGEQVSKGQILVQLNSPDLLSLQRDLLNDMSQMRIAKAQLQRDKALLEEGVISKRRWLETKSHYDERMTAVNEARQLLSISGMSKKDIEQLLQTRRLTSFLNIRSPTDGVVIERMVVTGQRIDRLAPLFHIANLVNLWLEMDVPQEQVQAIKLGDIINIEGSRLKAHVSLIGQHVNLKNQSVLVRAVIDGDTSSARPGQRVSARLMQTSEHSMLEIPSHALVRSGNKPYVFVRTEDGFEVRPVEIATQDSRRIIIKDGLHEGDRIALHGVVHLKANWMGIGGDE